MTSCKHKMVHTKHAPCVFWHIMEERCHPQAQSVTGIWGALSEHVHADTARVYDLPDITSWFKEN